MEDHDELICEKSESMCEFEIEKAPPRRQLPVDKGWAWIILIGVMVTSFLEMGMTKSFGLFYVEYQKEFEANAILTSLFPALISLVNGFAVVPIMTVGTNRFSCRQLVMTGGICLFVGFVLGGLSVNITMLIVCQGIFVGLGAAFIHAPSLSILGKYFQRRLGLVNGIANAFGSCGSIFLPFLLTHLFEHYIYMNAMLFTAAVFLHCTLFGALLRPLSFYLPHKQEDSPVNLMHNEVKEQKKQKCLNLHRLLNPLVLILVAVFSLGSIGGSVPIVFIPPYATENSLSTAETSLQVTIYGASSGIGQILIGFLADCKCLQRYQIICASLFGTGIVLFCVELCKDVWSISLFTGCYGLFGGALITLFVPMCIDFFGKEDFMDIVGFMVCGCGLLYAACSPIIGILKDSSGSYAMGFYVMAGVTVLAASLLLFIPKLRSHGMTKDSATNMKHYYAMVSNKK